MKRNGNTYEGWAIKLNSSYSPDPVYREWDGRGEPLLFATREKARKKLKSEQGWGCCLESKVVKVKIVIMEQ